MAIAASAGPSGQVPGFRAGLVRTVRSPARPPRRRAGPAARSSRPGRVTTDRAATVPCRWSATGQATERHRLGMPPRDHGHALAADRGQLGPHVPAGQLDVLRLQGQVTGQDLVLDRAPAFSRPGRVRPQARPRRAGQHRLRPLHVVFTDGLGFRVSDRISGAGAFMRCSTDHHNVLVLAAPLNFLHHTSWQVDDVDEVGRRVRHVLEGEPERHVGLGGTTPDPTSSGTSKTRRATSPSTTPTWTASWTTSCGPGRPRRNPRPVRLGTAAAPVLPAPEDLAAMMTGAHAPR